MARSLLVSMLILAMLLLFGVFVFVRRRKTKAEMIVMGGQTSSSQCCNCGKSEQLVIHHIVPLSLGGVDKPSNTCLLCHACHSLVHPGLETGIVNLAHIGRKQKAQSGNYAGGGIPLGYRVVDGSLLIDHEKADIVREIFRLREKGHSLRQIAETLNRKGYTTAQGKKFMAAQVKRVVDRREFYEGIYSYADIEAEGRHEPIL